MRQATGCDCRSWCVAGKLGNEANGTTGPGQQQSSVAFQADHDPIGPCEEPSSRPLDWKEIYSTSHCALSLRFRIAMNSSVGHNQSPSEIGSRRWP